MMKLFASAVIASAFLGHSVAAADTALEAGAAPAADTVEEVMPETEAGGTATDTAEPAATDVAEEASPEATDEREAYSPGYDFTSALASHVVVEQTAGILDDLIMARQEGVDRLADNLLQSLDVLSLAFPPFASFEFSDPASDAMSLEALKEEWNALNGLTQTYDLGPTEGVVNRALGMVSDYLTDRYLPKLAELKQAEDMAQSTISAAELYVNFLGVQTILELNAQAKYDTITLYGSLANAVEIAQGINRVRSRLETVRRLMVDVRKGSLTAEKQTMYREQLDGVVDEIETFAALLGRTATNG